MLPNNIDELNKIRNHCRSMSTRKAVLSGCVGWVPFIDIGVDVWILLNTLPQINREFCLTPEQIDANDKQIQATIYAGIKDVGAELVGKAITKDLLITIAKRLGVRFTAKQITKWVPIIGQVIAAFIGFGAMKVIINHHINECYRVAEFVLQRRG